MLLSRIRKNAVVVVTCAAVGGGCLDNPSGWEASEGEDRYVHQVVNVREDPTTGSEVIAQLAPNDRVFAQPPEAGWSQVLVIPNTMGFVRADLLHAQGLAPPFAEIVNLRRHATTAQWRAIRQDLRGAVVVAWRGWVSDVDTSGRGYVVYITMEGPGESPERSVALHLEGIREMPTLRLSQPVAFSGEIVMISDFLGILIVEVRGQVVS